MPKHVEFESSFCGNVLDFGIYNTLFKCIFCSNVKIYARELENSIELCLLCMKVIGFGIWSNICVGKFLIQMCSGARMLGLMEELEKRFGFFKTALLRSWF